jgi:hypothetical protein
MKSRAIDLSPRERNTRLEELRDNQWRRQQAGELGSDDKARLSFAVMQHITKHGHHGRLSYDSVSRILSSTLPRLHWTKHRVAEQHIRDVYEAQASKSAGVPVKRYLKQTVHQMRSRGLSARDAALALEAAAVEDPVGAFLAT